MKIELSKTQLVLWILTIAVALLSLFKWRLIKDLLLRLKMCKNQVQITALQVKQDHLLENTQKEHDLQKKLRAEIEQLKQELKELEDVGTP